MPAQQMLTLAKLHWFTLLLPALLLIELAFARSTDWSRPGLAEAAILFDLCVFVPLLYLLCYRRRLAISPLLMRAAGLALLGMFLASHLVPQGAQQFLPHFTGLRLVGLVLLSLVELWLFTAILRIIFSADATAERITASSGAPRWIARLMLLEARFWRALWRLIRRR
jgi:hypothetical protein